MKIKRYLIVFCILVFASLLAAPAAAMPEVIEFEYMEVYCSYTTGDWWWEGNVYHERGSFQIGYNIPLNEGDPTLLGGSVILVNLNYNTTTGRGTGSGKYTFVTDDEAGGFIGTWNAKMVNIGGHTWIIPSETPGKTLGHGFGEFEGWKSKTEFYHIDPTTVPGTCPGGGDPVFAAIHHAWYTKP